MAGWSPPRPASHPAVHSLVYISSFLPAVGQNLATLRATTIRELPAAHFPMLSRPDLVAACIEEIAPRALG
jgi:hypothetical protein